MLTEEDRRAKLENDAATKQLRLPWRQMKKEKQDWRRWLQHTAQVGPGDRGRKKSKKGMDLI